MFCLKIRTHKKSDTNVLKNNNNNNKKDKSKQNKTKTRQDDVQIFEELPLHQGNKHTRYYQTKAYKLPPSFSVEEKQPSDDSWAMTHDVYECDHEAISCF